VVKTAPYCTEHIHQPSAYSQRFDLLHDKHGCKRRLSGITRRAGVVHTSTASPLSFPSSSSMSSTSISALASAPEIIVVLGKCRGSSGGLRFPLPLPRKPSPTGRTPSILMSSSSLPCAPLPNSDHRFTATGDQGIVGGRVSREVYYRDKFFVPGTKGFDCVPS